MLATNTRNPREKKQAERPKNELPQTNMRIVSCHGTDGWEACVKYPMVTLPGGRRVQMGPDDGVVPGTQVSGFGSEQAAREGACVMARVLWFGIRLDNRI